MFGDTKIEIKEFRDELEVKNAQIDNLTAKIAQIDRINSEILEIRRIVGKNSSSSITFTKQGDIITELD